MAKLLPRRTLELRHCVEQAKLNNYKVTGLSGGGWLEMFDIVIGGMPKNRGQARLALLNRFGRPDYANSKERKVRHRDKWTQAKKRAQVPFIPDFYNSREWREVRYQALKKYGPRCQCCGASKEQGKVMHVDHIKPRSKFPALELELSNLQILCEDCNLGKSNKDDTDWRDEGADDHAVKHLRLIIND